MLSTADATATASETFTCELQIPGRKRPLTFVRECDGRTDSWFASTAKPGATGRAAWQGYQLSSESADGTMRVFPLTRDGMPGAWLPFRVREVTRDGSVALEVLPL